MIRHNKVAQYVHWQTSKGYGIAVKGSWYDHETPPVIENERVKILWDFSVQTDRTIKANRPDIIIKEKETNKCYLIDVSVPSDRNTSLKSFEKVSKYKDLEIELTKSWKTQVKTVPLIIGALGAINKSLCKYLNVLPIKMEVNELQKITLLGSANILRKALSLQPSSGI